MGNSSNYIEEKLGNPFYAADKNDDGEISQLLN